MLEDIRVSETDDPIADIANVSASLYMFREYSDITGGSKHFASEALSSENIADLASKLNIHRDQDLDSQIEVQLERIEDYLRRMR